MNNKLISYYISIINLLAIVHDAKCEVPCSRREKQIERVLFLSKYIYQCFFLDVLLTKPQFFPSL